MNLQSIRGMNDILPEKTAIWQYCEKILAECIQSYGYQEIRLPFLENTQLFKRAIGEATDIVEKEMYSFLDKNGDNISLRPEGTAGCVRACIQHHLLYKSTQKLWYHGPMFRHERPQKGRYRQFEQWGVEAYGFPNIDIEFELILMTARLWELFGIQQDLTLEINTLGTLDERKHYRQALVAYFKQHQHQLDIDSQKRLETNPLRILDSKHPDMQSLIEAAPRLISYLGEDAQQRFDSLCQALNQAGISFKINPRLVRGLDYYSHTVFEWTTTKLGAQATVCAGGRYDSLLSWLGEKNTAYAFGFAIGLERLLMLLENTPSFLQIIPRTHDVFCLLLGEAAEIEGQLWLEKLRRQNPQYRIITHFGRESLKSQFKKADKSSAAIALILGENEIKKNTVSIKFLREEKPQIEVLQENVAAFLQDYL